MANHKSNGLHRANEQYITRAIHKHGWHEFELDVLQVCDTQEELDEAERFWIVHLETHASTGKGYNLDWGGKGGGTKSESTRAKQSAALKGRVHSAESLRLRSEAQKGRKLKPESIAKREATRLARGIGYGHNKGRTWTRTSNPKHSKPRTPEFKAKIRDAALKRKRNALGHLLPGSVTHCRQGPLRSC